ncbi:RlmE family RNA methyltransferase [Desulfovermiculus halophilus]|uniref:RlmE family RNA methyltransferase n=1 Tax=Desulfovermiculus halophilus TaxID=339722 RepID=UPI000484B8D6|nr:RlmE family RNA methyltransferase [Desulfovermiculus halophilus]
MKKYQDHYFKKAKQDKYPARSVYKLQEIDKRFSLFRPGQNILDLGATPGSWAIFAAKKAGPNGRVLAVDINQTDTPFPPQVEFLQGDVLDPNEPLRSEIEQRTPFDLLLSDMAPKTTGVKLRDQTRSVELALAAMHMGAEVLTPGGSAAIKVFQGPDVPDFLVQMRSVFSKTKTFKPKSSRAESTEIFVLGLGRKEGS